MIKNVLPATLAAIIRNFKIDDIRDGLLSFVPSPELTPGRMNIFKFKNFQFMIDYAHNTGGFEELKTFMQRTKSAHKVGIITGVGDRRDADIYNLGLLAGEMFDEIIIRHDKDMRGRPQHEVTKLLIDGINKTNPRCELNVISDETEAIQYALDHAREDAFIVLSTDAIYESIAYIQNQLNIKQELEKELDRIL